MFGQITKYIHYFRRKNIIPTPDFVTFDYIPKPIYDQMGEITIFVELNGETDEDVMVFSSNSVPTLVKLDRLHVSNSFIWSKVITIWPVVPRKVQFTVMVGEKGVGEFEIEAVSHINPMIEAIYDQIRNMFNEC